jgi:hypothetical protein
MYTQPKTTVQSQTRNNARTISDFTADAIDRDADELPEQDLDQMVLLPGSKTRNWTTWMVWHDSEDEILMEQLWWLRLLVRRVPLFTKHKLLLNGI